jgi:ubiquinone/menaquinone biosynthesis C-methylase UbiE
MPFGDSIRWEVGDMMATRFGDASMAAITSISAIEHGVDLSALFREVSRARSLAVVSCDRLLAGKRSTRRES